MAGQMRAVAQPAGEAARTRAVTDPEQRRPSLNTHFEQLSEALAALEEEMAMLQHQLSPYLRSGGALREKIANDDIGDLAPFEKGMLAIAFRIRAQVDAAQELRMRLPAEI